MSTKEPDCEGRPRKRRNTAALSAPTLNLSSTSKFLLSQKDLGPVLVLVTPIRRKQGEILERNLREAGADVLDLSNKRVKTPLPSPPNVLVITDDASKARSRLKHSSRAQHSFTYVSLKWASAILAAQAWIPHEGYILTDERGVLTTSTADQSHSAEPGFLTGSNTETTLSWVNVLPVWYSGGVSETSDIADKNHFMNSLPPYLCQRCTMTQAIFQSPNRDLCEVLEQMAEKRLMERAGGDSFTADIRARAYKRASSALKCVPFKLTSSKDAEWLHSFGPRVLMVANEYLTTGTVAEADLLKTDQRLQTMTVFTGLYGVGYASARLFYDEYGLRDLAQLRHCVQNEPEKFSDVLVQYLSHYDDFRRTTRKDAESFKDLVEAVANGPGEHNLHLRFKLCGGFRRGEPSGHDVDLVYCRREERASDHNSVLEDLVDRLRKRGLVKAVLRLNSDTDGWGEVHYHKRTDSIYPYAHDILHGIGEYNGFKFRLDIVGVRDASEFCFATLAWSGSTSFQRDIRLWCENQKNWTFGQHGLFHLESGKRVELDPYPRSEVDIFNAMGLTYRPPYERSC